MTEHEDMNALAAGALAALRDEALRRHPNESAAWRDAWVERVLHVGRHGSLDGAPALPGSVPLEYMFGDTLSVEQAAVARVFPDRSEHWHREFVEHLILGVDDDDPVYWPDGTGGA